MPVLRVARHLLDEFVKAIDKRFGAEGFLHHGDSTAGALWCHSHFRKVSLHLIQDHVGPQQLEQASLGEPEQCSRKSDRDQRASVENDNWAPHRVLITSSGGVPSLIS